MYLLQRPLLQCLPSRRDWSEGRRCQVEADTLWRFVRRWHLAGENEKNYAVMDDELRDYILELRGVLDDEQARADDGKDIDPDDEEAAVQDSLEGFEEQLAEDKAIAGAENGAPKVPDVDSWRAAK